jgi:hypothetical protein
MHAAKSKIFPTILRPVIFESTPSMTIFSTSVTSSSMSWTSGSSASIELGVMPLYFETNGNNFEFF